MDYIFPILIPTISIFINNFNNAKEVTLGILHTISIAFYVIVWTERMNAMYLIVDLLSRVKMNEWVTEVISPSKNKNS